MCFLQNSAFSYSCPVLSNRNPLLSATTANIRGPKQYSSHCAGKDSYWTGPSEMSKVERHLNLWERVFLSQIGKAEKEKASNVSELYIQKRTQEKIQTLRGITKMYSHNLLPLATAELEVFTLKWSFMPWSWPFAHSNVLAASQTLSFDSVYNTPL